ncbi:ion channel [uncultured Dokdonia sp.]|uniref:ion channel n=1 Tax=uncultured Dokdonia sp. TaxID=575653 RepID=UPI002607F2B9|nr:ion channel [uncultured Dokdonia sp.]
MGPKKTTEKYTKKKYNDLGLGVKETSGVYRTLNKDGTFNVRKTNVPFLERINFFHSLVSMPWPRFLGLILIGYFVINTLFASIYMLIGVEHLTGMKKVDAPMEQFMEAFFFSAQTITTLGYGRVAPVGLMANIVAATESMLGLLTFALATGMLYGRFSKAKATVKYSDHGVIAPYRDINGFMFRVVNVKENQLLEVEVKVSLSLRRENSDLRDFFSLDLERSKVVFLPSVWTVVHPISDKSPLYNFTPEDLEEKDAEFIVTLKAFDESFSQTVYSRTSYKPAEIKWGQKFVYLVTYEKDKIAIDVERLDETYDIELNS